MQQTGNTPSPPRDDVSVLTVKLTDEQKREIRVAAAKQNKSMSTYVRELIFGTPELPSHA